MQIQYVMHNVAMTSSIVCAFGRLSLQ